MAWGIAAVAVARHRAGRPVAPRTLAVRRDHLALGGGARRSRRAQPVGPGRVVDRHGRQMDDARRLPRLSRGVPDRAVELDPARHGIVRGLRHGVHRDEPDPRIRRQDHLGPSGVPGNRRLCLRAPRHRSRDRRRQHRHDPAEPPVPARDRDRRIDVHGVERAHRISGPAGAGPVVGVRDVGIQPARVPRAEQRGGRDRRIARDQDPARRCRRLRDRSDRRPQLLLLLSRVPRDGDRAWCGGSCAVHGVERSRPCATTRHGPPASAWTFGPTR